MARLEAADMKAIYGDEYEAVVAREQAATKTPKTDDDKRRALAIRMEANETARISALALVFTGALLTLGSIYRTMGIDIAGFIGLAGVALGLVWYVWLRRNAVHWRTQLATKA